MSRTGDLIREREQRNARLTFGEDGWDGAPEGEFVSSIVEQAYPCLVCHVCGADGAAVVRHDGPVILRVDLQPGCQCGEIHADRLAYIAELDRDTRRRWALMRRTERNHSYNRGAARGRRS